jgi:hypothetical protein
MAMGSALLLKMLVRTKMELAMREPASGSDSPEGEASCSKPAPEVALLL